MPRKIKGIIFDFDGTLVDSIDDLANACNRALEKFSLPTHSVEAYTQMVGDGAIDLCRRASGLDGEVLLDFLKTYRRNYVENMVVETKPYPQIRECIQSLRERNIRMAINTNKAQAMAESMVEEIFGPDIFDPIIGVREDVKLKPDPQAVFMILEAWGLKPEEVDFVGDSAVDILTAKAAGVRGVGAAWGFRGYEELESAGADIMVERSEDLAKIWEGA